MSSLAAKTTGADPGYRPAWGTRWSVRWSRALRWEFWPAWLFYVPVVSYIILRSLRASRLTVFTAVNPGLEAGGFVGERKHEALNPLQQAAPELVAEFRLIPAEGSIGERQAQLDRFAATVGYPLVLKPDIGQRGRGVAIVRDRRLGCAYLEAAHGDVIAQRHVGGREFGVFAYRRPGEARATVLSITRKCFPEVVGNGQQTLAQLVLANARARLISPLLWKSLGPRLDEVPAAGTRVPLVEVGAHCRGALFLDGSALCTEALTGAVTRVFDAIPGYCFGRLDVRCPDEKALRFGHGLQVLEVNGVTAEAAHIYQPGTSLLKAWRSMIRQWSLAFEIGEANAVNGAVVTSLPGLWHRVRADWRRSRHWL